MTILGLFCSWFSWSLIHGRTISLRFQGIILRVLRIEVSVWIYREGGFPPFPPFCCSVTELLRHCKRLREFEEIELSRQAIELTVNSKEENSQDFCLDFVQEFGLMAVISREAVSLRSPHIFQKVFENLGSGHFLFERIHLSFVFLFSLYTFWLVWLKLGR
jgi:hypothetical protein